MKTYTDDEVVCKMVTAAGRGEEANVLPMSRESALALIEKIVARAAADGVAVRAWYANDGQVWCVSAAKC